MIQGGKESTLAVVQAVVITAGDYIDSCPFEVFELPGVYSDEI